MSGKLYERSDKTLRDLKASSERLEKLSIEYNPLNQIRQDLNILTNQTEKDYEKKSKFLDIEALQDRFEGSRVVDMETILEYCVCNGYTLQCISNYRSELSDKSIEAIKTFSEKNKINISQNKDNFFILAPRKYFKTDVINDTNVAFNIYYHNGFVRHPSLRSNLVEVYGSNFKSEFLSPINEIITVVSAGADKRLTTPGAFYTSLVLYLVFLLIFGGISIFEYSNKGMLIAYNFIVGIPIVIMLIAYKYEFLNKNYIKKLRHGETGDFLTQGKYEIK